MPIRGQGFAFTLALPPGAQATMELASSDPAGGLFGMLVTQEEKAHDVNVTVGTRIQGESDLTESRAAGCLPWLAP